MKIMTKTIKAIIKMTRVPIKTLVVVASADIVMRRMKKNNLEKLMSWL